MRDGIALAKHGKPAVALVTKVFAAQGNYIAKANGMPDIPRVLLPHPVAGSGEVAMRVTAENIVAEICAYLSGERLTAAEH